MGTITTGIQLAKSSARAKAVESDEGKDAKDAKDAKAEVVESKEPVPLSTPRRVNLDPDVLAKNRVICPDSPPAARAAYKMLRTRVLRRLQANRWESMGITSLNKGEGKTLTTINLAISIASQHDQSVILVDLDLRNPTVYKYLGLSAKPGLDSWFDGNAELGDLMVCPNIDRLFVIPNRVTFAESSELLQSQPMLEMIDQIRTAYPTSLVLFDLPPILEADDVLAFTPHLDTMLLVVSQGQTERNRLPRAKELLEDTNLLGVVLNKSDEASSSYY